MSCWKCCEHIKDEDNSPKNLNDKVHQSLSRKIQQHMFSIEITFI